MRGRFLSEHKDRIGRLWLENILAEYQPEAAAFLKNQGDAFQNPIGATLRSQTKLIVDGLADGCELAHFTNAVASLVRIRAVQEIEPSKAVAVFFGLSRLIREQAQQAGSAIEEGEIEEIEERVEALVLEAFDQYVACREQIFTIRVNELRNRSLKVMERLNEWRERRTSNKHDALDAES